MKNLTLNYLLICCFTFFSLCLTAQIYLQNCGTGEFLTAATSGSNVTMSATSGALATQWKFEQNSNGLYNIDSQIPTGVSGRGILRALGSGGVISTNISPPKDDGDKSWTIEYDAANDAYRFKHAQGTNRYLNVNGSVKVSNVPASNFNSLWKEVPVAVFPLDFISFTAQNIKTGTQLNWEIDNEVNNDYFEILKGNNIDKFRSIGRIEDQEEQKYYQFLDRLITNQTSYYKIKQVDLDGKFSFSNIINVKSNVKSLTLYPNPVGQHEDFTIESQKGYQIFNSKGALVKSGTEKTIKMDLEKGVYFLKQNDSAEVERFIVQ